VSPNNKVNFHYYKKNVLFTIQTATLHRSDDSLIGRYSVSTHRNVSVVSGGKTEMYCTVRYWSAASDGTQLLSVQMCTKHITIVFSVEGYQLIYGSRKM